MNRVLQGPYGHTLVLWAASFSSLVISIHSARASSLRAHVPSGSHTGDCAAPAGRSNDPKNRSRHETLQPDGACRCDDVLIVPGPDMRSHTQGRDEHTHPWCLVMMEDAGVDPTEFKELNQWESWRTEAPMCLKLAQSSRVYSTCRMMVWNWTNTVGSLSSGANEDFSKF